MYCTAPTTCPSVMDVGLLQYGPQKMGATSACVSGWLLYPGVTTVGVPSGQRLLHRGPVMASAGRGASAAVATPRVPRKSVVAREEKRRFMIVSVGACRRAQRSASDHP